jgi:folate-dependent phosphoribosylglycinamide formyltransferase PurN
MIKLKSIISEIITEYEKGEPLIFTHGCVDSYRGQNYCNLIAKDKNGNFVGSVSFSTYENQIHINMINTKRSERRKGIATAMAKELQKEYPNFKIIWGMTTSFGSKFLEKLPKKFKAG